ncbi:MAG: ABC transporter substrate-binding protein [Hyphomicrobiaceae bacterium]|nr:ABC transporter substrate-binding protein [Hyphomicrobiaceae bacterium]
MKLGRPLLALVIAAALGWSSAASADTVKVGVIAPFSGPTAAFGTAWKQAIDAYQKQHGDTVAGHKVEIVMRDLPGPDPLKAKALAQELVVKEGVQYLAGLAYSPNALALGAFANQARVPIVILNAATSEIIDKSPYFLRVSYTTGQVSAPEALYAAKIGHKAIVTMVSDYAPGWDAEKSFADTFEKAGGKVVGKIRMPLATTDFGPYLQRARTMGPEAILGFLPGGGPTFGFLTAYNNSGLSAANVAYLGQGETSELYINSYGDVVKGLITTMFYSADHRSKENDDFKKALYALYPDAVISNLTVCGYDGIHLIYKMIEATGGQKDADKAIATAKGLAWESPRGPVRIDPETRDWIQNIYVRRVEADASGKFYNKEIMVFPMQPDYGRSSVPVPTLNTIELKTLP